MTPLIIIPARSGSKRIPNKNFKPIVRGVSPLRLSIWSSEIVGCTLIVTSDIPRPDNYRDVYNWHQAPPPIHQDACSAVDVVLDVLGAFSGDPSQPILYIQPTQPLRQPKHLKHALTILEHAQSVASVVETYSIDKLYRLVDRRPQPLGAGVERDQHGSPTYAFDGTVYGFKRGWFEQFRSFRHPDHTVCFVVPPSETARLDSPFDWDLAALRLSNE